MKKEFISPKAIYETEGLGYSHAVKVGDTIYLAGTTGRDKERKVVEGGFEAQAAKAFENVKLTLEAAGGSLKDVVKLTVYFRNLNDVEKFRKIRASFFTPPMPASTFVEISKLAPGVLVEVDAVAVLD